MAFVLHPLPLTRRLHQLPFLSFRSPMGRPPVCVRETSTYMSASTRTRTGKGTGKDTSTSTSKSASTSAGTNTGTNSSTGVRRNSNVDTETKATANANANRSGNSNGSAGTSPTSSTGTAPRQTAKRGYQLFQNDIGRVVSFLRGDFTAFNDRTFKLFRYDATAIAKYYDGRPLTAFVRVSSVGIPFLIWLLRTRYIDKFLGLSKDRRVTERRAEQLRGLLCWAGPTYLKVGQAVGNRPDLVGAVYSSELQKLVDDVGTFDSAVALQMVRDELGLSDITEAFDRFDEEAIASASLGQVHKATLRSGEAVAIKVQRPTVERDAALDVYVLRKAARFAKTRFGLRSDLVGIVDEFATRLWEELDYINEADNCERFAELYAKSNNDVYVPKVYRQYTTKRILCLEWIDGDKAPWLPKDDAQRLIRIGVQCSLEQLLDKGFVHADPHGGNLLRTKNGKLCYLDFGMCVDVKEQIRYDLIAAIVRLINRDFENLAQDFIKLGFLPKDADTKPFAPLLIEAFGDASTGGGLSDLSFSRLADNLSGLAYATPIRIPVFFTLIIRSLTILEGFALQTDASFKIVDESYPYVVKRVLTDESPVLGNALRDVLIDSKTGRLRWNRLSGLLQTKSSSVPEDDDELQSKRTGSKRKPSPSNGSLAGMSDQALERVIDFLVSERGTFLRNALFLDLTETADAMQLALLKRVSDATNGVVPGPREDVDFDLVDNAIALAQAFRVRVPEFLSSQRASAGKARGDYQKRMDLLRRRFSEASRTVAGNLVERNTRRVLRKTITTMFGSRHPPS